MYDDAYIASFPKEKISLWPVNIGFWFDSVEN